MKIHTTNYTNTFILVANDCPTEIGETPYPRGKSKTLAEMQFELIIKNPYKYTSDDILFQVYANKNDLNKAAYKDARDVFFSKGQPCLRTSPLTKRYGFGVHCNENGKIALYGRETKEYERFFNDKNLKIVKAMRTKKI